MLTGKTESLHVPKLQSSSGTVQNHTPHLFQSGKLDGFDDDRLGPFWNISQFATIHDLATGKVEDEFRLRNESCPRISFLAVVVNTKLGQLRHELNEI